MEEKHELQESLIIDADSVKNEYNSGDIESGTWSVGLKLLLKCVHQQKISKHIDF